MWLAQRDSDGLQVALKTYHEDRLRDGSSRAQREYEALQAVQAPGIVRAIELVDDAQSNCLVLELLPGESVASWACAESRSVVEVLRVGVQVAAALESVHTKRWIHRDLSPANIQIDPATLEVFLADFGSARVLGSAQREAISRSMSRSRGFGAGLAYSSPEQTGRMGRGVDARSDLYSTGACLFFALTRRPPFDLTDPLALLHAHMARVPETLHQIDPSIPVAVSRVVAKLLAKEPEDRYQSARALREDLGRCLTALEEHGEIPDDLELGTVDTPLRPVFRQTLYGREAELSRLRQAFDASRRGRSANVVFIRGAAGTGKSALIDALRPEVARVGGSVAHGQFDGLRRATAHVALRAALAALADQILCAGDEHVVLWQNRLCDALGNLAGVITDFVPSLRDVIGEASAPAPLAAREAVKRLEVALERLLRALGTPEIPLVLSLDDLQWANSDSLALIETLICSTRDAAVLWALSYRSDESAPADRVRRTLEARDPTAQVCDIELGPLERDALIQMIADALGKHPSEVVALTHATLRKTDASPLLVQQFLLHLHGQGLIRSASDSGWTWDDAEIARAEVQEGAVALMCAKLERLSQEARAFVYLLSCIGNDFHAAWISELTGEPQARVEVQLFELADAGLIIPSTEGFQFAHQRIREACASTQSEEERARIHHRIGQQLLASTPLERMALACAEISTHLQLGADYLSAEERFPALAVHLAAGERTLGRGTPETARTHLAAARALLREEDWNADLARTFSLLHESIEAELLCGDLTQARELADQLAARPLEGFNRCRALAKRIRVLASANDADLEAQVIEAVRVYGLRWKRDPSPLWIRLRVYWLDWCLRGPLDERCFRPPRKMDFSWAFPTLIVHEAGGALVARRSRLIDLSIFLGLHNYRRHGTVRSPALPLAGYAAMRIEVLQSWRGLRRYAEAALAWSEKTDDTINLIAKVSLFSFALVWLRPRRGFVDELYELADALEERGEVLFAGGALVNALAIAPLVGRPLPELLGQLESAHRWEAWPKLRGFLCCYAGAYSLLADPDACEVSWKERTDAMRDELLEQLSHGRVHWLIVLCLFEQYELADPMIEDCIHSSPIRGSIGLPEMYLLRGLSAAHAARRGKGRAHTRERRRLKQSAAWLRARAKHAPDCAPLAAFLDAELATFSGAVQDVVKRFVLAAKLAREAGFLFQEAWIYEQSAHYLVSARRELQAVPNLRQAAALYTQWGARSKATQIEQLARRITGT